MRRVLRHAVSLGIAVLVAAAILPGPERAAAQDGQIHIVGSGNTLLPLVESWIAAYAKTDPDYLVSVSGEGTMWGPTALMSGRAQIAAMSRELNEGERDVYRARVGGEPLGVTVGLGAIAIYVNDANPLEGMSLEQVDAVFSLARRCGGEYTALNWGDLGLEGPWERRPIEAYGRHPASGTGSFFQDEALCGGVLTGRLEALPGDGSVARSVAESIAAIGFGSFADPAPGAKALPLARGDGEAFVAAEPAALRDGSYPLTRPLVLYARPAADGAVDPRVAAFLAFTLSEEGQALLGSAGFVPASAATVAAGLAALAGEVR